jgi:hypothetical protein
MLIYSTRAYLSTFVFLLWGVIAQPNRLSGFGHYSGQRKTAKVVAENFKFVTNGKRHLTAIPTEKVHVYW